MDDLVFVHKGKKCVPITKEQTLRLKWRDKLKYIGPYDEPIYGVFRRRPVEVSKPWAKRGKAISSVIMKGKRIKVFLGGWNSDWVEIHLPHWSLVEIHDNRDFHKKRAKRYVSGMLRTFRNSIQESLQSTKRRIDRYINALPLAEKIAFLRSLSKEDKETYDFICHDTKTLIKDHA